MKKIELSKHTIFSTRLSYFLGFFSRILLKIAGWKFEGHIPVEKKCIVVGAPHTSNWDFLFMLLITFLCERHIYWMGKHSMFCPPFNSLLRWLGGIAIERGKQNNSVDQMVEIFKSREELVLVLSPEGTRKGADHWKRGFYRIAEGAKVPIFFGFIDYRRKKAGIRKKAFVPTGNTKDDVKKIRGYYEGVLGNIPQLANIRFR